MSSTATSSSPPMAPRRKKAPRPNGASGNGKKFGCLKPVDNPLAVRSYFVSLYGLIPVAGAICGPVAAGFGVAGLLRRSRKPEGGGGNFAIAGIVLGGLEMLTHAIGLPMIARGFGW